MRRNSIGGVKKHCFGTVKKKTLFFRSSPTIVLFIIQLRFVLPT